MKKRQHTKGSALLTALIFAFVVMTIVSAMAYNFRMSSLTVGSLLDREEHTSVDDGYLDDLFVSVDVSEPNDSDTDYLPYRFTTTPEAILPVFYSSGTDASLYHAEPYLDSLVIRHQLFFNDVVQYTKELIFNNLANVNVIQKNDTTYTLDVPYISINSMTDSEKDYKLSDGKILDSESGYVGYIEESGNGSGPNLQIQMYVVNNLIPVDDTKIRPFASNDTTPTDQWVDLDKSQLAIGWNLVGGHWYLYLAIYDNNTVFTTSTSLRNLVDSPVTAELELSLWSPILRLQKTDTNPEIPGLLPSDDIVTVAWYHSPNKTSGTQQQPMPLVIARHSFINEFTGTPDADGIIQTVFPSVTVNEDIIDETSDATVKKTVSYVTRYTDTNPDPNTAAENTTTTVSYWDADGVLISEDPPLTSDLVSVSIDKLRVHRTLFNNVSTEAIAAHNLEYQSSSAYVDLPVNFDISKPNVHIVIPDPLFTLSDKIAPVIFVDKTAVDYNFDGTSSQLGTGSSYYNGGLLKKDLLGTVTTRPVVIRKSYNELYILYLDTITNSYHQYTYIMGDHTLGTKPDIYGEVVHKYGEVTADGDVLAKNGKILYLDGEVMVEAEVIQEIMTKFGAVFVVTAENIYVQKLAIATNEPLIINKILRQGVTTESNYNISRDEATGRIYLMPDGLDCRKDAGCLDSKRVYIDTDCTDDTCATREEIAELDDIFLSLGLVYQRDVV